jgi:hypothetical protein
MRRKIYNRRVLRSFRRATARALVKDGYCANRDHAWKVMDAALTELQARDPHGCSTVADVLDAIYRKAGAQC